MQQCRQLLSLSRAYAAAQHSCDSWHISIEPAALCCTQGARRFVAYRHACKSPVLAQLGCPLAQMAATKVNCAAPSAPADAGNTGLLNPSTQPEAARPLCGRCKSQPAQVRVGLSYLVRLPLARDDQLPPCRQWPASGSSYAAHACATTSGASPGMWRACRASLAGGTAFWLPSREVRMLHAVPALQRVYCFV